MTDHQGGSGWSGHPIDVLLWRLWVQRRIPTDEEVAQIKERLSSAPFNPAIVRIGRSLRGTTYLGRPVRATERSLFAHLVQRVVRDRQWADSTSQRQYLADLRRAAKSRDSQLALYEDGPDLVVAVLGANTLPAWKLGPRSGPLLFVVYSARTGRLLSGYQLASADRARIAGDALWLRK